MKICSKNSAMNGLHSFNLIISQLALRRWGWNWVPHRRVHRSPGECRLMFRTMNRTLSKLVSILCQNHFNEESMVNERMSEWMYKLINRLNFGRPQTMNERLNDWTGEWMSDTFVHILDQDSGSTMDEFSDIGSTADKFGSQGLILSI